MSRLTTIDKLSNEDLTRIEADSFVLSNHNLNSNHGSVAISLFAPRLPLVHYSKTNGHYTLDRRSQHNYPSETIQRLKSRFLQLRDYLSGSGQIVDTRPAPQAENTFKSNNMGESTRNSVKPWLKVRFYRGDKDDPKSTVANVPYRLYDKHGYTLLAEGTSPAEGFIEYQNNIIKSVGFYHLEWAPVGSIDYIYDLLVPAMEDYELDIPDAIHELVFSPNEHYCLALDKQALEELDEYDKRFDEAAVQLQEARALKVPEGLDAEQAKAAHTKNVKILAAAQARVRELLQEHASEAPKDPGHTGSAPLTTGKANFAEVLRVGKQKYSLVPQTFIDKYRGSRYYNIDIPSSVRSALRVSLKNEGKELPDALLPWRYTQDDQADDAAKKAGSLNPAKLKEVWKKANKDIKLRRGFAKYTDNGQIPSKYVVAGVLGPVLATHFDDELKALDKWIAQVNKDAKVSVNQYDKYQKRAVEALDKSTDPTTKDPKKYFLPEDWDIAKRMVWDIWGEDDELYLDIRDLLYADAKDDQERRTIRDQIANKPLPATRWDASMGAQLMRYSLGGNVEGEFDLLAKGQLGLSASAGFDAALAEAKAEVNGYLPDSNGHPLTPTINGKQEIIAYKPYGNNESGQFSGTEPPKGQAANDFMAHFEERNRPEQYLPYFIVKSCLVTPAAAAGIFSQFQHWGIVKQTGHAQQLDLTQRGVFVQVIGHTSAPGSIEDNKKLGLQRATITADFIQQQQTHWLIQFNRGLWSQDEVDFMGYFLVYQRYDIIREASNKIDWQAIGKGNESMAAIMAELKQRIALNAVASDGDTPLLPPNRHARYFPSRANWAAELPNLIKRYQEELMVYGAKYLGNEKAVDALKGIRLYSNPPLISQGESDLKNPILDEIAVNRRCEFLAWEVDPEKSQVIEKEDIPLNLGNIYLKFQGYISAWAGANMALGGEITVASPNGALAVVGNITNEKPPEAGAEKTDQVKAKEDINSPLIAGANAGAFAGAKAELGLKGSIDWRKPQPPVQPNQPPPPTFVPFGSVGYAVTGLAGVGFKGQFKIGFNAQTGRFIVKINAQAALGPGVGGQLDIVVNIAAMWDFVTFVHGELARHHFSYLDIFETKAEDSDTDTFELFSALAWKLLAVGSPLSLGLTIGKELMADQLVVLLNDVENLIDEWLEDHVENKQVEKLIETLNQNPDHIQYLTPETKGRILYDFLTVAHSWQEDLGNLVERDINKLREDATVLLIEKGIHSLDDWRETFEHIGEWQGDQLVFTIKLGAKAADKAERVRRNIEAVQARLLDDPAKLSRVMDHYQTLIDNAAHSQETE